jgi:hypothetical protein
VGIEPQSPNPEPKKMTKIPPKKGECRGRRDERVGALKENELNTVQTTNAEEIWILNLKPMPAPTLPIT